MSFLVPSQKAGSASTAGPQPPLSGAGTAPGTTCATRAGSTTR